MKPKTKGAIFNCINLSFYCRWAAFFIKKPAVVYLLLGLLLLNGCTRDKQSSHQQMISALQKIYAQEKYPPCFGRNDLGLEVYRNELSVDSTNLENQLMFGYNLIGTGKVDSAIIFFSKVLQQQTLSNTKESKTTVAFLSFYLGLSYLRKGELVNCINNCTSSTCIFPINNDGMHIQKEFVLKAIPYFAQAAAGSSPVYFKSRWLLNLCAQLAGDFSDVPTALRVNMDKFNSTDSALLFKNIAKEVGVNATGHYGASIIDDFNNDGYFDIFLTSGHLNETVTLYTFSKLNGFENTSEKANLNSIAGGCNAIQADYDNDGYLDIYIMRGGWMEKCGFQPNGLLHNNGNGTFTDVTYSSGLLDFKPSQTAVWADFNNDGWMDIFTGNEEGTMDPIAGDSVMPAACKLFLNSRIGKFYDATQACGISINKWVKGVTTFDIDNDGWMDIYVSCYGGDNLLLKNEHIVNGKLKFNDISSTSGTKEPYNSFGVVADDFNNDGFEDIFVCGYDPGAVDFAMEMCVDTTPANPSILYLNNHNNTFTKQSADAGLNFSIPGMGLNKGDFDNDGFNDLYIGTGNAAFESLFPNILLKNINGTKFLNVTNTSRTGHLQKTHGISVADLDRDGDADMYVSIGGLLRSDVFENVLFENISKSTGNYFSLKLQGTTSAQSAIGARLEITVPGNPKKIFRRIGSGGSYGCSPLEQFIGIGSSKSITELIVLWPSGKKQVFKNVPANQAYFLKENSPIEQLPKRTKLELKKRNLSQPMCK